MQTFFKSRVHWSLAHCSQSMEALKCCASISCGTFSFCKDWPQFWCIAMAIIANNQYPIFIYLFIFAAAPVGEQISTLQTNSDINHSFLTVVCFPYWTIGLEWLYKLVQVCCLDRTSPKCKVELTWRGALYKKAARWAQQGGAWGEGWNGKLRWNGRNRQEDEK